MKFAVLPELESGAWFSSYPISRKMAEDSILAAQAEIERFESAHNELVARGMEPDYAEFEIRELDDRILTATVQAVLFTCLWIEGTVNHWGTVGLGENFFRQHVEKLTLVSKLSVLIAVRKQRLLAADSDVVISLNKLFDARNRLVHRKTREFEIAQAHVHMTSLLPPMQLVEMARVAIAQFRALIREAERDSETLLLYLGERETLPHGH